MSAATMQQPPAIPPRPTRSQDKDNGSSVPSIPPRPTKRSVNRSVSPNHDRFAPSPLNEGFSKSRQPGQSSLGMSVNATDRSSSVDLPSIGQEGQEYAAFTDQLDASTDSPRPASTSPEQTRTVGEDIQLYAPKPTMPAQSAKQRVMTVTRTDSDKAASFGLGRPTVEDVYGYGKGLKKKASTTSQLSNADSHIEDEHGIPEIGQRVPMLHYAGDVQAPSPAPSVALSEATGKPKNHSRKHSGRTGFDTVPPGSYGLHGHGVAPADKFEKAYYEKHPELHKKEIHNHWHDRANDFSMSSEELNKIVRDTASRGAGFGTGDHISTPSEQVGHQATEEYTSRISSPRPPSAAAKHAEPLSSPLKGGFTGPEISVDDTDDDGVIHVDDHGNRKGYHKYSGEPSEVGADTEEGYEAPILAPDEVAKGPSPYELQPAVAPPAERRGSSYEMDQPRSRPSSRPTSIYSPPPQEMVSTPLDDVEEYEPLFPEDDKGDKKPTARPDHLKEVRHRFPSQDVWEDAPNSVHATAEVNTPEPAEGGRRSRAPEKASDITPREGETIAQAFARRQEELAELEDRSPDHFAQRRSRPPSWVEGQPHLNTEVQAARSKSAHRFPSRDVWEDTPDSLQFTTTVSTPQDDKEPESPIDQQPTSQKPSIPARPPKKQSSGDDKPAIPDRPKPQIPARPSKSPSGTREPEAAAKQKPAVPARPVGGKIAALQAGFMSDLNKRLQLGPQAPKKDEPTEEVAEEKEKEKAPLPDARKGRARGPQRRAPTKSPSPSSLSAAVGGKPVLSFSTTRVLWSIDEEGTMTVDGLGEPVSTIAEPGPPVEKTEPQVQTQEVTKEESKEQPTDQRDESENAMEPTKEPVTDSAVISKPAEESAESEPATAESAPIEETQTLATNTAGESILDETVAKKPEGDQVQDVGGVKDEVVS
ncbi:hypothetical protein PG985_002612 [Apiospora marii]|uniref:Altered inheritance of mitochondria protein 21 n=1 Tax=Apiospora marii TaxID=335849 RepID=A0ABR1RTD7_9PEZI